MAPGGNSGGGGTTAEITALNQFSAAARDAADNISSALSTMIGNLSAKFPSYVGEGGSAFQATVPIVDHEMTKLHQALFSMADDVKTAGVRYAAADESQAREVHNAKAAVSDLTSKLGG